MMTDVTKVLGKLSASLVKVLNRFDAIPNGSRRVEAITVLYNEAGQTLGTVEAGALVLDPKVAQAAAQTGDEVLEELGLVAYKVSLDGEEIVVEAATQLVRSGGRTTFKVLGDTEIQRFMGTDSYRNAVAQLVSPVR